MMNVLNKMSTKSAFCCSYFYWAYVVWSSFSHFHSSNRNDVHFWLKAITNWTKNDKIALKYKWLIHVEKSNEIIYWLIQTKTKQKRQKNICFLLQTESLHGVHIWARMIRYKIENKKAVVNEVVRLMYFL